MAKADYLEKMDDDLLEQFRGQPNISVVIESYARQFQEVYEFFASLLTLLDLDKCVGRQLDLIGEIVVMSRYDARVALGDEYEGKTLDDNLYRKLLKYKILLNTSDGTYRSLMKGIKMFWDRPMYYSEDPESPATIFLKTPVLTPDVDVGEIMDMPIPRPGGVGLKLVATVLHAALPTDIYVGSCPGGESGSVEIPELDLPHSFGDEVYVGGAIAHRESVRDLGESDADHHFSDTVHTGGAFGEHQVSSDELPELDAGLQFKATAFMGAAHGNYTTSGNELPELE